MAIRDYWGFDNLPAYTTGIAAPTFLRGDIAVSNTYSVYGSVVKGTGSWAGWLTGVGGNNPYPNTNYGIYNPVLTVVYQNLSDFTTRRSFLGFRFQTNNNTAGTSVLYLVNTAGTKQNLVIASQLALNTSQYIEVMIDRLNTQIVVWIDGVQVSTTFFDFNAFVAADNNALLCFGMPSGTAQITWYMRDNYFLDDTQDATQCNRLGPVDVRASALASVTAPNWVSSDSQTPLVDLSTVLGTTGATQTTPTLTEPPSMDPVQFTLSNAGIVPAERILAVKADISAQRTGGYTYAPQISVSYNNQSVNGKKMTYAAPSTMVFNQNAFLMEIAPDGTPWTPQAVSGAVATLTP